MLPLVLQNQTMDILKHKHYDSTIPKRGPKENTPDGSKRQDKKLADMCKKQDLLLREERITKVGSIAVGEWRPDMGNIELVVEKGKIWHTMGFHGTAGKKWLRPVEALFLLETSSLDLHFHGVTMSLQEAYAILIPNMVSMEYYQVYCYLMRLGYIVSEHKRLTFTDYEYRIRLNQYAQDPAVQDVFQPIAPSTQTSSSSSPCYSESSSDYTQIETDIGRRSYRDTKKPTSQNYTKTQARDKTESSTVPGEDDDCNRYASSSSSSAMKDDNSSWYGKRNQLTGISRKKLKIDSKQYSEVVSAVPSTHDNSSNNCSEKSCVQLTDVPGSSIVTVNKPGQKAHGIGWSDDESECCSAAFAHSTTELMHEHRHKPDLKMCPNTSTLSALYNMNDTYLKHCKKSVQNIGPVAQDSKHPVLPAAKQKCNLAYTAWNFNEIKFPNLIESVSNRSTEQQLIPMEVVSTQHPGIVEETQKELKEPKDGLKASRMFWNVNSGFGEERTVTQSVNNSKCPTNWGEYKLMKKQEEEESPLHMSPMSHVWQGDVQPLVKPSDAQTTGNLLYKLQTIRSAANISSDTTQPNEPAKNIKIDFDVYLPECNYKKSSPGMPNLYVIVSKIDDEPPSLSLQMQLLRQAARTPLIWAIVDNGDISFYTIRGVEIPPGIELPQRIAT